MKLDGGVGILFFYFYDTIFNSYLVTRNEALRVAYIHVEESGAVEGKTTKEFYSKLVKADIHGKDQVSF